MVQITQSREEPPRPAHPALSQPYNSSKVNARSLVPNDQPPLPTLLNLIHLNHRSIPPLNLIHHHLINLQRVLTRLLEETLVRDSLQLRRAGTRLGRWSGWEGTSGDEVAPELL